MTAGLGTSPATNGLRARARRQGQVFWSLSDQIIVSGSSFVTSVLVARNLGIEQFGVFALINADLSK